MASGRLWIGTCSNTPEKASYLPGHGAVERDQMSRDGEEEVVKKQGLKKGTPISPTIPPQP